jgi:hypothetical protein
LTALLVDLALPLHTGPVDAAYKAIDGLVRVDAQLVDYSVNSVTEGIQVGGANPEQKRKLSRRQRMSQ